MAGLKRPMRIGKCHQHLAPVFKVNMILVAEMLDPMHPADNPAAVCRSDLKVLGADANRVGADRHRGLGNKARGKKIDLRRAKPAGDITVTRILINFARCAELKKLAVPDDSDTRRHRHGLDLIMRHIKDCRAQLDLNPF